jgi:hypothetical protein
MWLITPVFAVAWRRFYGQDIFQSIHTCSLPVMLVFAVVFYFKVGVEQTKVKMKPFPTFFFFVCFFSPFALVFSARTINSLWLMVKYFCILVTEAHLYY